MLCRGKCAAALRRVRKANDPLHARAKMIPTRWPLEIGDCAALAASCRAKASLDFHGAQKCKQLKRIGRAVGATDLSPGLKR